ncbi:hypothetical protein Pcinc_025710 [Petrolisthes cinctipes]|uniref:Uncharacterized protein n=1 Tax=Petrolisthes cinctipes TaxID=88211 RepID=A0AAE1F801_PETCI|nr:hypothetical protein Pcinc_025710 [Petrolisthes cinctipes]
MMKTYEPKGFLAEVVSEKRREARVSVPLFLDDVPYSRMSLPPLVPVEMLGREVAALVHTASHVSLVSSSLIHQLGSRNDVIPDTSLPPSPLNTGGGSPWLVEGKIRYVELTINGSKHVTQLYVARDLPADIVLGVDFLKKAQVRVSFPENAITFPGSKSSGKEEVKVAFLSTKEVTQYRQNNFPPPPANINNTRAYSSNY